MGRELPRPHAQRTSCHWSFVLANKCLFQAICSLCGDVQCDHTLASSFQTLGRADQVAPSCCGDQAGTPEVTCKWLPMGHNLSLSQVLSVSLLKCGHTALLRLASVLEFQRVRTVTKPAMLPSRPSVGTAFSVPLS